MKNKIRKYFGSSFEIDNINEDSIIPVGGNILKGNLDQFSRIDKSSLERIVNEMGETSDGHKLPKLRDWLENMSINVDERLFSKLYAFTEVYDKEFGFGEEESGRKEVYLRKIPSLSEFLGNGAVCAEISALAQLFLQEVNINSTYFSGGVLWEREHEHAEPHTFILIDFGKEYIFDPSNPHSKRTKGSREKILIPRIQEAERFREKVDRNMPSYVETKNSLTGEYVWYGTGKEINVLEEHFV